MNIRKLTSVLEGYRTKYVLIDTPGQLELFAFRESSKIIVEALGRDRSMLAYLSDPMLCRKPNGFVSSMMLSALVQFRLQLPMINLLSKADTLSEDEAERMIDWFENPDALYGDFLDEDSDPQTVVGMELFKALENTGVFGGIRSVSAEAETGLEEIYASAQLTFFGGEDAEAD
jgi:GTPase SAR1 family protein